MRERCTHVWKDGWGEHECHGVAGHDYDHMCDCDARDRQPVPPIDNSPETVEARRAMFKGFGW